MREITRPASILAIVTTAALLAAGYATVLGQRQGASAPMTIARQGAFAVGGQVLGDPKTRSLHCDHGYVDYQIPVNARRINLVMWHSAAEIGRAHV